jgi:HlyD family secretion protein
MAERSARRIGVRGVLLALVLLGVTAAFALRDRLPALSAQTRERALPAVALAPPAANDAFIAALGRLQPKDGVRIIAGPAQAVAVVGELLVDEGDLVVERQLLAKLDDAELRAAIVQRAEARLANARVELSRKERLRASSAISEALVDELRLAHDVALAELRLARAELARVEVRSPVAGQVIEVHARAGERVGPAGILELGETGAMYAVAEVYETEIADVALGARAEVRSPALPRALGGHVERIAQRVHKQDVLGTDPAARVDARVIEVEVRLDEADVALAAKLTHLQVEVAIQRTSG